ncbi:hypothetical protein ACIP93_37505 [Streptomyces sp. NPDC088745]|uniref:hypothetical protein n=1 Tax=Streptomyces sp. NPDC088745 TaxID=3365884 RepID=UPI0038268587
MTEHQAHDAPSDTLRPVPPHGLTTPAPQELRASWQLPAPGPDVDVSTVAATHAAVAFAFRWQLGITAGVLLGGLAARLVQSVQEAVDPSGMRLMATLVPGDVATVSIVLPKDTPPGDLADIIELRRCTHAVGYLPVAAEGPMYFAALKMAGSGPEEDQSR